MTSWSEEEAGSPGARWRYGEAMATNFVESTVDAVMSKRVAKQQHMQWTRHDTHVLLQRRAERLNHELVAAVRRWDPDSPVEEDETRAA